MIFIGIGYLYFSRNLVWFSSKRLDLVLIGFGNYRYELVSLIYTQHEKEALEKKKIILEKVDFFSYSLKASPGLFIICLLLPDTFIFAAKIF